LVEVINALHDKPHIKSTIWMLGNITLNFKPLHILFFRGISPA